MPSTLEVPTPSSSSLIRRRFDTDAIVPKVGELIKLRFSVVFEGPGSALSSSALTTLSDGRQAQHSALVLSVGFDIGVDAASSFLLITAYPIPAYSNAHQESPEYSSAAEWLAACPEWKRNRHVPVPPAPMDSTPPGFSVQLSPTHDGQNGREPFVDRKPCWVVLQKFTVAMPFTRTYKTYKTDVIFPMSDVLALQHYERTLSPLPNASSTTTTSNTTTTVNCYMGYEQERSPEVQALYRSLGQDFCGGVLEYPEESDDDSDDDGDDQDYTPLEVSRIFAPWISYMAAEVEEHDKKVARQKCERTISWIEQIMFSDEEGDS
ncbi:hypothetical protein K440DRAFT_633276 [Wilcoxina mikolae CBS 423.85]|nr:hypothetical protein K440DRAFT_633276 [Wilcoxina mikolae CBS 423.85]